MSEAENVSYGLVVSFPDQSASFVHGFEAGMLWARLEAGREAEIETTTHVENREVITRMAISKGWEAEVSATGTEGWNQVRLRKINPTPERANPHGLRLVAASLTPADTEQGEEP